MAEVLDTRPWQAAVDPALLAHLRRPLRRSAALGCAWARQALARARLRGLPMFDNWAARWGIRAAELAATHPIVHARTPEHEPVTRPPSVAAQPSPAAPRPTVTATPVLRTNEPSSVALPATPVAPSLPATSSPAGPDIRGIDLRVDPSLLATSRSSPVPITHTTATDRTDEPAAPRRRPTRSRVVTTWDLAREQASAASSGPSPVAPIAPSTIEAAPILSATIEATPLVQPTHARPTMQVARPTTQLASPLPVARDVASLPVASPLPLARDVASPLPLASPVPLARDVASPLPLASPLPVARDVTSLVASSLPVAGDIPSSPGEPHDIRTALPASRPRVHARHVAPPMLPVLSDSRELTPTSPRPRVPVSPAAARPSTSLVAPTPEATGLDLTLPPAVAARVGASPPAPAPAPPVAAPVRAVATTPAALDIPAIAEAVQRHLERQLRWERERRGGRP
jgi:hypothetical protein